MWDIYSLVFSCKHYMREARLGALLEFCIYLPPVLWQAQFASVRGWSGGGSLKNVCHCSAKVVRKENLIYFNGFSSIASESVCLFPCVNSELNFKCLSFQKGCILPLTVQVGCCLCIA